MATMMKEKSRAKKKSKEKRVADTEITTNVLSTVNLPISEEKDVSTEASITQDELKDTSLPSTSFSQEQSVSSEIQTAQKDISLHSSESSILVNPLTAESRKIENKIINPEVNEISSQNQTIGHAQGAYKDVCHRLDIISFKDVPVNPEIPFDELENKLEASSRYISQATDHIQSNEAENIVVPSAVVENMVPSAPIFEENLVMEIASESQESLQEVRPIQLQCMPLEVAMHICGGKEMAEIREMSEREEAIAEAGMALSPEHPLVDLLSTYRCSAIALEQENQKILKGYSDEEKSRSELWKIEKRTVCQSVKCNTCAQSVSYKGTYDYATLLKEKLPAAQLRLEGLLKDAQESYCHHQHQALLAYYQIEEFISEVVQGSTGDIREALTLVLQELRASGATTCLLKMEYFIDSLKRWARVLCGALLKKSDPRQLLFLLHQLSRQSHSVRWAAPLIRIPMCDGSDAARAMAILDLMLAAPVLEAAKECTEESEEMWEEVDRHGDAGAVSEGALRERDLLALLRAFPLRALVARLVLLPRSVSYRHPAESEEMWEEVDRHGDAGAVSEGALRERDLLALLRAFPLRALVARLVLLPRSVSYRHPAESEEMWEEVDRHGDAGAVSEGALRERDLLALLRAFPLRALVARLVLLPRSVSYRHPAESEEMWEEVDRHGDAGAVSEGALRERDLLALLRAFPLRALVARLVLLPRSVSYRHPAESEEMWEEVDRHGDAGAVSEGALRERDLLALLRAFPLRALVARLVLLPRSVSYRHPAESEEMWEEVDRHGDAGAVSEGALRERDLLALLRAFPLRALVARLVLLPRSVSYRHPAESEEMWEEVDRHGDAGAVSEGALRERDLLALLRAFPLRALVARLVLLPRSVSYRHPAESEEMWEEVDRHGDAGAVSEGALRERDLLALLRAFPLRALVARLVLLPRSVSYRHPAESEEMWEEVDRHGDAGAVSEGALRERDLLALLRAFPLRALVARLVLLPRSVSYRHPAESEEMWEEVDRHGDAGAVSEGALRERDLLALLRAFPLRALVARLVLLPRSVSYRHPAESEEMWEEVDRHGDAGAVSEGALRERDLLALLRAFPLRALVAWLVLLPRSVSYRHPAESEEMWEEVDRHGDAGAVSEGALRERDLLALLRAFPLRALVARLVLLPRSVSYRHPAESEEMWEEVDRHGDAGAVSEGALRERDLLALLRAFPLRALVARLVLLPRSVSYRHPAESEEMWEEVDRHGDAGAVSEGALRERDLLALLRAFPLRALVARLVLLPRSVSYRHPAESEEMWEEVDRHGDAGAVSEGALRERDLLALLRAFPLRALVARLVLLPRSDITQTRPYEWEQHARDVLRACCGVRALLATLTRAARAHARYSRLRGELRALGKHAMHAVADLHRHNRDSYPKDLEVQIEGELEAIFRAGWGLLGAAQPPPAALLRPAVRSAYCVALMTRIHEKPPLVIGCISLQLPPLSCGACVRAAARAADCACDAADTPAMLADFLVQVALKPKKLCNGECIEAARECLPRLLVKHDYLFTRAVHSIAYVHQLEPLQPSGDVLKPFCLHKWRPSSGEVRAVLDDWSQRSPKLLQYLLQALSYTPYNGLSLESQLAVGSWLCALPAPAPDWAWNILTRLRVHRSSWRMPLAAPAPELTEGVFAEAYAVLAGSWGHSLPVICEHGVSALSRVAAARAPVAAHALPLVMTAMMDSPESVALTPQFASLLSLLLAPAQSLVQWARGERASAPELLLRRILAHVENQPSPAARDAAVSTWLHGLYHAGLSGTKLAACDAVLLAARHTYTPQEAPKPEVVSHFVRHAQHAPLSCAAALHAAHAQRELSTQLFPRLLVALATQRAKGQKIHVDNALKQIGSNIGSEELVIYQTAAALLAPAGQPSLPLWRLLMHLYLHSSNISSDPAPIGPCFFAGLIKSRTLAQLKKRLHDTILYHHNQADTFKTLLNTRTEPKSPSRENKSVSPESVAPRTSIADLTGETSHESDTESGEETGDVSESEERRRVNVNMLAYHEAAEKMLREYDCFLETGERLRATPIHADIARFIPDAALNTAWAEQLNCIRPAPSNEDDDLRAPKEPAAPDPPLTALQSAVTRIMRIRDRSERRSQLPVITSPVGDVSFSSQRQLYTLVDKHLADLQTFARQWCADVNRVATLDSKLWPLVRSLRHRKALAPVRRLCHNKCGTVVLSLENHYEWPISENAARGIAENRSSAKVALRELLRARPQEAKTVAALHTIARRISGCSEAVSAALSAWNCARDVGNCGAAHAALVALVDRLADRWICSDSRAVLSLMPVWCASASMAGQQALCRALVARVAAGAGAERPRLYVALLQTVCVPGLREPQRAFSYLSKFDLSRCVDDTSRGLVLEELGKAAQCWGREPDPELNILLELIGVHLASLTTAPHLPAVARAAARAAAAGRAPPAHVAHVARAAACAGLVPFDKLGHLLRDLGSVWWHARSVLKATRATYHVLYAEHVAALQHTLLRAFVAQGKALSYAPERVSLNAWSALQESWGAWVSPHPELAPLLPSTGEEPMYTTMVKLFMDNIHQMMLDCPGCEEHLLSLVWEWAIQIYLNVSNTPGALDSRIQMSELLAELGALPWSEHQWPRAACLPAALQISTTNDLEMQTWLAGTLRGVEAATWLRGGQDCDTAPRLAALLQLFAGPLPLRTETLEQAAHLPWPRLPEAALDQALERFFVEHHNPLHPYHDTPQFRVVLAASALAPPLAAARARRACAVSRWTRAAAAPALLAHVPAHAAEMLSLLAAQEPHVEEGSDELEELVGRAAVIMCMEPAAAEALPVWEKWIASASPRLLRACVSAARGLTTFEYFAPVADAAAAALMAAGGAWAEVAQRLSGGAWARPRPLLERGRLHAAYALALALTTPVQLLDLSAVTSFVEKEVIISVWICAMCRAALGDDAVQSEAARAQLAKLGEPPRLALLRALSGAAGPTHKHRLLCRLALCIITPNSEALIGSLAQAHQACPGVLVSQLDLVSWARAPSIKHLPKLAVALFPGAENYFAEEVRITSGT